MLAPVLAAATWLLIRGGIRLGHDVVPCDYNCPPDGGLYAPVPALGIVVNVVLAVMLVPVLRLLGVGIVLVLGPLAAVSGWNAAVADGRLPAEAVSGEIGFWRTVAIVGTALAVLGLLMEVRLSGPVWRLFGWVRAPGELRDYSCAGTAVLTFTDLDGAPRQTVVRVRQQWMLVPVRAWYPTRDPTRARISPAPLAKRPTQDR